MADKWAQYTEPAADKWAKYSEGPSSEANRALAGTGLSVSQPKAPIPAELGPDQNISPWKDPTQGLIGQGVRQIGRGVAGLTREGADPKMEAASDIVGGVGKIATPVAIGAALPALAAAPAATAAGIVGGGVLGAGLGAGGEAAAEALGAGPGGKALARQTGEVAGGVLGYKAGSAVAPAIGRVAGRIMGDPDPLLRMLPKGKETVAAKDYLMGKPPEPVGTPAARDAMQRVIRNQTASPSPTRAPSDVTPRPGAGQFVSAGAVPPEVANPPFIPPAAPLPGGRPGSVAQRIIRNQQPGPVTPPEPVRVDPGPAPEGPAPLASSEINPLWDDLAGGKGEYAKLSKAKQAQIEREAELVNRAAPQREAPRGPQAPRPASYYGVKSQAPPPEPVSRSAAPPPAPPIGANYMMPPPADVAPPAFSQPEGFTSPGQQMPAMPEAHPKPPLVRGPGGQMQNPLQAIGAAERLRGSVGMPEMPSPIRETMPPVPETKPTLGETQAPNFEPAFGSSEGAEPNYKPTKEAVIKGHQTIKAKNLARAARDYDVSLEKAGAWKLGGPELKKLADAAGVNPPNSPESLARFMEELAVVPAKKDVTFALGGLVKPKKPRYHRSRRGILYGPTGKGAMPPSPQAAPSDMLPEPEMP